MVDFFHILNSNQLYEPFHKTFFEGIRKMYKIILMRILFDSGKIFNVMLKLFSRSEDPVMVKLK